MYQQRRWIRRLSGFGQDAFLCGGHLGALVNGFCPKTRRSSRDANVGWPSSLSSVQATNCALHGGSVFSPHSSQHWAHGLFHRGFSSQWTQQKARAVLLIAQTWWEKSELVWHIMSSWAEYWEKLFAAKPELWFVLRQAFFIHFTFTCTWHTVPSKTTLSFGKGADSDASQTWLIWR